MRGSSLFAVVAMLSMAATPVAAATVANPAASLSLAPVSKLRVVTKSSRKSQILGLPLLAILAAAAAVTAVVVVASDNNSSSS